MYMCQNILLALAVSKLSSDLESLKIWSEECFGLHLYRISCLKANLQNVLPWGLDQDRVFILMCGHICRSWLLIRESLLYSQV